MFITKHASVLSQELYSFSWKTQLINILCYILVILGFIGNILGLFVFSSSRRSWRVSSTYAFLATCSSITNLLCVIRYSALLHSSTRHSIYELVGHHWWACKFYEFSFSFRVVSSWNTLFWMFERLMCISTRLRLLFSSCNSYHMKWIVPFGIIVIILICVIGPPMYMYQPQIFINQSICEVSFNASFEWQRYFSELHLGFNDFTIRCLFSELIPTGVIIMFNCIIIHHLLRTHRRLSKRSTHRIHNKQSKTRSWMNIVLILHSLLFLCSILSHIVGHFMTVEAHRAWWVLLSVLMNCSLNFYVYCLSGKAFRNEIRRLIRQCKRQCHCKQRIWYNRRQLDSSLEMNNI